MIKELEQQARLQMAACNAARRSGHAAAMVNGAAVAVHVRTLRNGRELFGYSYEGVRLERSVLLQLLCTDTECPQCQQTKANWLAFRGLTVAPPKPPQPNYKFRHLIEERVIESSGRRCIARPAVFRCRIHCPVQAHAPAVVRRTGWDLFENGQFVAGGLVINAETKEKEPTFPTIEAATTWVSSMSINEQ
jgi:hypothetical protein